VVSLAAMSNPNVLLSQTLCKYLNQGRTLNAVAYLCEMATMAKLECAPFSIILDIGTIFT